ncbi:hypothetical protein KITKAT_97 [Arthrobacter phage Kitkat]|uniref:Uncharacterized protein n=1 Tax=Arthrobacter phage Kitkat TaxID=1796996 RepID=A0A140G6S3_9CAUD|nr:hypothetical protein BJD77_gp097 [Arthrobacter phage Kitkat]AMM44358.1 hypothetical protein KITKAT_97 [Arthrobacter phage Kitkat]
MATKRPEGVLHFRGEHDNPDSLYSPWVITARATHSDPKVIVRKPMNIDSEFEPRRIVEAFSAYTPKQARELAAALMDGANHLDPDNKWKLHPPQAEEEADKEDRQPLTPIQSKFPGEDMSGACNSGSHVLCAGQAKAADNGLVPCTCVCHVLAGGK